MSVQAGMSHIRKSIMAMAIMLVTCLLLSACYLPWPSYVTGSGKFINAVNIGSIKPGMTTKDQMLEMLGPPMGIIAPGETVQVQRPAQWVISDSWLLGIDYINSDTFFELFSERNTPGPEHRVYYYYRSVSKKRIIFLLVYLNEKTWLTIDRLWVLVNEKTGIVEDYFYRSRTEDKQPAKRRAPPPHSRSKPWRDP